MTSRTTFTSRRPGRAVVAGAGVFGIAAALELRRRGWHVTVADPGPLPRPAAASTDRSKVVRMDYGRDEEMSRLAQEAMAGWERWNEEAFSRPLFHRTGFLLLSRSPLKPDGFEAASLASLEGRGIPVERLDADTLRTRFPAWNADRYPDGYLSLTAGWAESGEVVRQLLGWAREAGVRFVPAEVVAPERGPTGRITAARLIHGERLPCQALVVAAGAWTPAILAGPGFRELSAPDLTPTAMPVLLFAPADPGPFQPEVFPVWSADISRTGWYGFPAGEDGIVKIGHHGSGTPGGPTEGARPGAEWEERCRRFLRESIPGLAGAPLAGSRSCWYCDSRDGDFWIGPHPGCPGLVVASGGSGHGFKFAPVLGELVANAVEGVDDGRLDRFRWRTGTGSRREHARFEGDGVSPG